MAKKHLSDLLTFDIVIQEIENQLGDYQLLKVLGSGAFGTVFLAQLFASDDLPEKIALKVIKKDFLEEIRIHHFAQITIEPHTLQGEALGLLIKPHPNVMRVYGMITVDDRGHFRTRRDFKGLEKEYMIAYCLEDLSEYSPVLELIPRSGFSLHQVQYICRQVVEGLLHLHQCGVAHYDIKSANLLLRKEERKLHAKIVDLSEAKPFTPMPEVPKSSGLETINNDSWHLGYLLYYLATREPPFPWLEYAGPVYHRSKLRKYFESGLSFRAFLEKEGPLHPLWDHPIFADILNALHEPDLTKRLRVKDALKHPFFQI